MSTAPRLLDAAVDGRLLVYGSLPPHGRDLDLLVRASERRSVEATLRGAGFVEHGAQWARFERCTAEAVELAHAESWDLPEQELARLFEQALPLDGLQRLVRPAPHHALLILARRTAGDRVTDSKRLSRVRAAYDEDPCAWERARAAAPAWGVAKALAALWELQQTGTVGPATLAAARAQRHALRLRRGSLQERASYMRQALPSAPRPRRAAVIALSGLDGCGKSTQAAALRETLERLGHDAVVVRTRISWEDWLWKLVPAIKRLLLPPLHALARARVDDEWSEKAHRPNGERADKQEMPGDGQADEGDLVRRLRRRSPLLTHAWLLTITLANAWSQWRLMARPLLRGATVICDRYTLDSIVELRYAYGAHLPLRLERLALARLYPAPARAYLLDVPVQTALERKGEWGEQWLASHRTLYLEEAPRMGVSVLDGERPLEELCAQIAREVWTCAC